MVGAPGGRRQRAGRDDARRDAGAVLGADGDEEEVRRGEDARFLRYELDRYLLGRGTEQKKELPLSRVENQAYIHYHKGSLVHVRAAGLHRRGQAEPRDPRASATTTRSRDRRTRAATELLQRIRAVTPPELQYLIDDLFETITLYDNRAVSATAKALADGKYEVTLKVVAKKRNADELGKESDVAARRLIDIGVLDAKGDAARAREEADRGRGDDASRSTVDKRPRKAGIDPLNKLIDRRPGDNAIVVTPG